MEASKMKEKVALQEDCGNITTYPDWKRSCAAAEFDILVCASATILSDRVLCVHENCSRTAHRPGSKRSQKTNLLVSLRVKGLPGTVSLEGVKFSRLARSAGG